MHLNSAERKEIALLKRKKYSLRDIAAALDRSVSTISDELSLNKVRGRYDPKKATHKAYVRRKYAKHQGMKIAGHKELRQFVEKELLSDQSPAAIAGRIKKKVRSLPRVSKNTIYRYIKSPYGRKIEYYRLKRRGKSRRRLPYTKPWKDRTFIDQRPKHINARSRVGNAEVDFIVSGKAGHGIILVVVDRKLRVSFLEQILHPTQQAVTEALQHIKQRYSEWRSMTTDNDILLQHHKKLEVVLGIRIYFCHPYHSWEKGTVENTNKHIRRDILKRSDISCYSKKFIQKVEDKLNNRYMAVLDHATPAELLEAYRKRKKRRSAGRNSKK